MLLIEAFARARGSRRPDWRRMAPPGLEEQTAEPNGCAGSARNAGALRGPRISWRCIPTSYLWTRLTRRSLNFAPNPLEWRRLHFRLPRARRLRFSAYAPTCGRPLSTSAAARRTCGTRQRTEPSRRREKATVDLLCQRSTRKPSRCGARSSQLRSWRLRQAAVMKQSRGGATRTAQRPSRDQVLGRWNAALKRQVADRLTAWFEERGIDIPDDLLFARVPEGSRADAGGLRTLVQQTVAVMTPSELAALQLLRPPYCGLERVGHPRSSANHGLIKSVHHPSRIRSPRAWPTCSTQPPIAPARKAWRSRPSSRAA